MIKMSRPTPLNLWTVVCGGDSEGAGNINPGKVLHMPPSGKF